MLKLSIPERLKNEFETVEALWASQGETRRVDSLILSWTKYEKQLRRIFCFLVYQHPRIDRRNINEVVAVLAANRSLYPTTFEAGISALGVATVKQMMGDEYTRLQPHVTRINQYRNKLIHGQISGQNIQSAQIERDVKYLVAWISSLADGAFTKLGYDGLMRNTYTAAKGAKRVDVAEYPFSSPTEFESWLTLLAKKGNQRQR